jgi:hypothetical protein
LHHRVPFAVPTLLACLILAGSAHAQSPDRWVADADEARATLPAATGDHSVTGAVMACAEQRWTLRLEVADPDGLAPGEGTLTIGTQPPYEAAATVEDERLVLAVPSQAIEPIKAGLRLALAFEGPLAQAVGAPSFPLRGSRLALQDVEEACSRPDMSAYDEVAFSRYSPHIALARTLRQADIEAFTASTTLQAELTAAMVDFGSGRRVLFTRICGASSWYFGLTGCNVTGFAEEREDAAQEGPQDAPNEVDTDAAEADTGDAAQPDGAIPGEAPAATWRIVYDSEGVLLHVDPLRAGREWPDLVTLPLKGTAEMSRWRWDGASYTLLDPSG